MKQCVQDLLRRIDLTQLGEDHYEGEEEPNSWGRLFGGMVAAQSLSAATRTVPEGRLVHSLHAYFLRPGNPNQRVHYSVDRIRDGRSFTTRRVVASQEDKAIFNMSASFHVQESGYEHQIPMPEAPAPEGLKSWLDYARPVAQNIPDEVQRERFLQERPVEMRYMRQPTYLGGEPSEGSNAVWFRAASPLPNDPALHRCVLTYASDMSLLDNVVRPHGRSGPLGAVQMASLDHAMWFHVPDIDLNDWHLYAQDSPAAHGARGFARGDVFTRNGRLVASVAQEGLIRPMRS